MVRDSLYLYFPIRSPASVVFYNKQFMFQNRIYIPWFFNSILIDWPTPYLCQLRQRFLTTQAWKGHFRRFMYAGSTVQCCVWQNSNHMCGASGVIAAVTRACCPCDISCCLAVDREKLQGSFSQTNVTILIKCHVFWGVKVCWGIKSCWRKV